MAIRDLQRICISVVVVVVVEVTNSNNTFQITLDIRDSGEPTWSICKKDSKQWHEFLPA